MIMRCLSIPTCDLEIDDFRSSFRGQSFFFYFLLWYMGNSTIFYGCQGQRIISASPDLVPKTCRESLYKI